MRILDALRGLRLATPWRSPSPPEGTSPVLVFASELHSSGWRSAATLMRWSGAVMRGAAATDGCHGVALMARPLHGAYYTASLWRDEAALHTFSAGKEHREAVKALRRAGDVDGVLMSWWAPAAAGHPSWHEVMARTAAHQAGPYRGPVGARQAPAD